MVAAWTCAFLALSFWLALGYLAWRGQPHESDLGVVGRLREIAEAMQSGRSHGAVIASATAAKGRRASSEWVLMRSKCRRCGYELSGIPLTTDGACCPECGSIEHVIAEEDWLAALICPTCKRRAWKKQPSIRAKVMKCKMCTAKFHRPSVILVASRWSARGFRWAARRK